MDAGGHGWPPRRPTGQEEDDAFELEPEAFLESKNLRHDARYSRAGAGRGHGGMFPGSGGDNEWTIRIGDEPRADDGKDRGDRADEDGDEASS